MFAVINILAPSDFQKIQVPTLVPTYLCILSDTGVMVQALLSLGLDCAV